MALFKTKATSIFLIVILALWAVRLFFFTINGQMDEDNSTYIYISVLFRFFLYVISVIVVVKLIEKEPLGKTTKLSTNLGKGLGIAAIILVIGAIIQVIAMALNVDQLPDESIATFSNKVISPAFFEEYFFRGFILVRFMNAISFTLANVLTSIIFVLFHSLIWLIVPSDITITFMVIRSLVLFFIISLPAGLLLKKTDSVWPCIAFHGIVDFITIT